MSNNGVEWLQTFPMLEMLVVLSIMFFPSSIIELKGAQFENEQTESNRSSRIESHENRAIQQGRVPIMFCEQTASSSSPTRPVWHSYKNEFFITTLRFDHFHQHLQSARNIAKLISWDNE